MAVAALKVAQGKEGRILYSISRSHLKEQIQEYCTNKVYRSIVSGMRIWFWIPLANLVLSCYCYLYRGAIGAAGEDFADLRKDVVGWGLRDPELATVTSSGLAQPVTGTEHCVSPSGEATVWSWCWSNEAWVRWVKRSGLVFSMSRGSCLWGAACVDCK